MPSAQQETGRIPREIGLFFDEAPHEGVMRPGPYYRQTADATSAPTSRDAHTVQTDEP